VELLLLLGLPLAGSLALAFLGARRHAAEANAAFSLATLLAAALLAGLAALVSLARFREAPAAA
jgi:hypothetical protein